MITPIPLVQAVLLPSAVAVQYTCPANSRVVIRHVTFCNSDTSARTVTAYVVPSGGSVGAGALQIDAASIASKATYVSPELSGVVMNAGDTLQSFADTGAVVAMSASGIQQT